MCKGNAGRGIGHGRLCLLGVSEVPPGEGILQRGAIRGAGGTMTVLGGKGRSSRFMGQRTLTCRVAVGPPVSGGLFDFFRFLKKMC